MNHFHVPLVKRQPKRNVVAQTAGTLNAVAAKRESLKHVSHVNRRGASTATRLGAERLV
jgi:hypothetical protein